ncbi:MAG: type II toxin-antitoxin system RelE/ParE family toxin, partial [Patescibacteria group bacterium]
QKEAQQLTKKDRKRIAEAIRSLRSNPFQGKKLQGEHEGEWSIRVWPYRIIYTIEKAIVTVIVLRIGHRREVYR